MLLVFPLASQEGGASCAPLSQLPCHARLHQDNPCPCQKLSTQPSRAAIYSNCLYASHTRAVLLRVRTSLRTEETPPTLVCCQSIAEQQVQSLHGHRPTLRTTLQLVVLPWQAQHSERPLKILFHRSVLWGHTDFCGGEACQPDVGFDRKHAPGDIRILQAEIRQSAARWCRSQLQGHWTTEPGARRCIATLGGLCSRSYKPLSAWMATRMGAPQVSLSLFCAGPWMCKIMGSMLMYPAVEQQAVHDADLCRPAALTGGSPCP